MTGEGDVRELALALPEIGAEPGKFFTTPHYDGHAMVLVRLEAVDRSELAELLEDSWRLRAPKRVVERFDAAG